MQITQSQYSTLLMIIKYLMNEQPLKGLLVVLLRYYYPLPELPTLCDQKKES